ncbi:FAD/NAD(P)-binding protein [Streptomyces nogalater]
MVGGGASAVCLVDALAGAKGGPGRITVFEPSPSLWRGRAYQVDSETVKVNATPDDMSVRAGDPHHFERWLEARERVLDGSYTVDPYSGARFAPRTVYGEYLEQTAYAGLAELRRQGWRVDLVGDAVTAARREVGRVRLTTRHGGAHAFDYVVLCVGGDGPKDVYGLAGTPGFTADPYPVSHRLRTIGADQHVAVVGSGLTAVDIVLALAAQGHRGRISLLSRSGVLPGVRQRHLDFEPTYLTRERMRSLARSGRVFSSPSSPGSWKGNSSTRAPIRTRWPPRSPASMPNPRWTACVASWPRSTRPTPGSASCNAPCPRWAPTCGPCSASATGPTC